MTQRLFARLSISTLIATIAFPVAAQTQQFDDLQVHYNAVPASVLGEEMARAYGLSRSGGQGLVTIAVQDAEGVPVDAVVQGSATNLAGHRKDIRFRELDEDGVVSHIGQFPASGRDTWRFAIEIRPQDRGNSYTLEFQREFFDN